MSPRSRRNADSEKSPRRIPILARPGLHLAILVVATFTLFAGALDAGFTFDDQGIVVHNTAIRSLGLDDVGSGWTRQVRTLSLKLDYALFGLEPFGYHVQSLLWHLLSVVLLYAGVVKLTGRSLFSFVVALLFAAHPIHVEAVANVSNRKELLCMAFSLATLLAYCRFLATAGAQRWKWLVASGFAWLLALFSKEVAAVLPVCVAAYELLFLPADKRFLTRSIPLAVVGGAVGAAALLAYAIFAVDLENVNSIRTLSGFQGEASVFAIVLTSARAFWAYVRLLAWPGGVCPDHVMTLSSSLTDPATILAWVGLAGWVGVGLACWRRAPLVSFGLAWIGIQWLPVSNLVPTVFVMADRYMYIPSAGFVLLVACAGDALRVRLAAWRPPLATAAATLAAVSLVALWSFQTLAYLPHWNDQRSLWAYTVQCNPRSARGWNGLGYEALQAREYRQALDHFTRAVELEPRFPPSHFNRATALLRVGDLEGALRTFDTVIERWPGHAEAYYNRGNVRLARHEFERAVEDYDRAIALADEIPMFFHNRASARMRLGKLELAIQDLERAIELDPSSAETYFNLGSCYGRMGDLAHAFQSYQTAASLGFEPAQQVLRKVRSFQASN